MIRPNPPPLSLLFPWLPFNDSKGSAEAETKTHIITARIFTSLKKRNKGLNISLGSRVSLTFKWWLSGQGRINEFPNFDIFLHRRRPQKGFRSSPVKRRRSTSRSRCVVIIPLSRRIFRWLLSLCQQTDCGTLNESLLYWTVSASEFAVSTAAVRANNTPTSQESSRF